MGRESGEGGHVMSLKFVVIHEAPADFAIATEIADRVLLDTIDWLDTSILDTQREWVGVGPDGERLAWKTIKGQAQRIGKLGIRIHGHFDGEPAKEDAHAARIGIAYVLHVCTEINAILLIRDADDRPERRDGLEQARRATPSGECPILIGVAVPEREAWVLCGFDPLDGDEIQRLAEERRNLGFDPRLRSHELIACKDDRAKKSPKRVLSVLTNRDGERQRRCWRETAIGTLENRGTANGLAAYLNEVGSRLVPILTGP